MLGIAETNEKIPKMIECLIWQTVQIEAAGIAMGYAKCGSIFLYRHKKYEVQKAFRRLIFLQSIVPC